MGEIIERMKRGTKPPEREFHNGGFIKEEKA